MRKPLLALGLVVTTGFGAFPVANVTAATSTSPPPSNPPPASPLSPKSSTQNSSPARAVSGADIVRTAMKFLGYPYAATGASPSTGFSCIGFVSYVYRQNGISLPGDLGSALKYAPQVSFSNLMPGDIMYFQNTVWPGLSHAAIYIGGGKFVHAEWYNRGVVITSFYNDSVDGNYWPAKYLTSNRPWTGAAVGSVVPTTPNSPTNPTTTSPGPTTSKIPNGPSATVTAKQGLYMRSGPSKSASPIQVLAPGTTVYVIGKSGAWTKIQLASGTTGWVMTQYLSTGAGSAPATTTNPSVGNPTAPSRVSKPGAAKKRGVVTVSAATLNVRSSPSSTAAVVGGVSKGQQLTVIGVNNGWYKVLLPDGSVGWVSAAYVTGSVKTGAAKTKTTAPKTGASKSGTARRTGTTKSRGTSSTASAALNVRSGPSLNSNVVSVIPIGGSYQILGWSNGWARVRLPNGTIGWVSGTVIGTSSTKNSSYGNSRTKRSSSSKTRSSSSSKYTHLVTAGVRVHSGASIKSPVVGLVAAGTKVAVIGYRSGWARIRSSTGMTGFVLGSYVN